MSGLSKIMAVTCEYCPLCRIARARPESAFGRIMHWHGRWCPAWKAHEAFYSRENAHGKVARAVCPHAVLSRNVAAALVRAAQTGLVIECGICDNELTRHRTTSVPSAVADVEVGTCLRDGKRRDCFAVFERMVWRTSGPHPTLVISRLHRA